MKTPKDFKVGEVYQMKVASRSHVSNPYYVIIRDVRDGLIETDIPDQHSLRIPYPSLTWDYQIPRMKFIGDDENAKKLVQHQIII